MRCFQPIDVFIKSVGHAYNVPCGRCQACKKRKQSEWTLRMDLERRFGKRKNAFFLTLTYHDNYVPLADATPVLVKKDLQSFFKRLRRYNPDMKVSYFACGEYGDKFDRPHFHACVFTDSSWQETRAAVLHAWSESVPASTPVGSGVFLQDGIYQTKRRSFGRITLSSVNMRRMRYCAKYITKDSVSQFPEYPKFAIMSKGLGLCLCKDSKLIAKCVSDDCTCVYTEDGRPSALPRYLSHRIFTREQLDDIQMKYLRRLPAPPLSMDYESRKRLWREQFRKEQLDRDSILKKRSSLFNYC